ncbi:hypothetical protein L3Q65_46040 [Amycolatopsis sp. FU40]|uniref:hypothetical protein n=1 Tax=Amycolatopsis sp. FU40 TaxID=2914159 RepID=UPI001F234C49|nr:hypothetical protein [Amycolatopsis sp. FU40]UKD55136.1 hypothetical protein L3Q65_46040 [Amycolatopsis sp. FU40]
MTGRARATTFRQRARRGHITRGDGGYSLVEVLASKCGRKPAGPGGILCADCFSKIDALIVK